MIQQGFSWQDEGKIKKPVSTNVESVKEGSMLLFSFSQQRKAMGVTPSLRLL